MTVTVILIEDILKSTGNIYKKGQRMIKRGYIDNPNRCIVTWLV